MTAITPEFLFVYGSLLPGLAPPVIAPVMARLRSVGRGLVRGHLFDLGRYPGLVLAERGPRVHGHVHALPPDPEILRKLDRYEGFFPENRARSEFIRRSWPVTMPGSGVLTCWIYEYGWRIGQARIIAGGDYLRLARQRRSLQAGRRS
ncbi:MAG TPA: gamma-glutamylcyclotransferase family protein [Terriglobales bacterium]|nr:gamma-glutamylcyclotransferase family protein [Terriglobales bacterium]